MHFHVPAAYTSVIDPVTGFVNVFQKQSLKQMISFTDLTVFHGMIRSRVCIYLDYQNFKCNGTCYQNKWSLYADVDRIETIIKIIR
ncbi:MAG: hypothetical protein ACLTFZ_10065 [Lachnospiraceae bacterium]